MSAPTKGYLEHVAILVRDIRWHMHFFREVFGMTMREVDGTPDDPKRYWTLGGMQFNATPDFGGPEGRLLHLGIMCDDLDAAIAAATRLGATELPEGRNWLRLPEGLILELMQASPGAVAQALAVNPRG